MKLNDITELIIEDVEALVPILKKEIEKYVELRIKAHKAGTISDWKPPGMPRWPDPKVSSFGSEHLDTAVEYVLRADPRYLRDTKKKLDRRTGEMVRKPLNKCKSPFAKSILKWWLDPQAGGGISFPEDILTTAEILHKFNLAKQQPDFKHEDHRSFKKFSDLVNALKPYLVAGEELASDAYARMGLELVFDSSPWKMYLVDEWVAGDESTLHPGQVCHKAFEGTEWCVKYKHNFEKLYKGNFYMVLHGKRRFALLNFPSKQYKDLLDHPISEDHYEKGAEFLRQLFTQHPSYLAELGLASIEGRSHSADFKAFEPEFAPEMKEVLNTPAAKTAAERDATHVVGLAKYIDEWPHFSNWPEGLNTIIGNKSPISDRQLGHRRAEPLRELVKARGRMPEIEDVMSFESFKAYVGWIIEGVGSSAVPQVVSGRQELTDRGRNLAQKMVSKLHSYDNVKNPLRSAVNWLTVEFRLWNPKPIQPWPEMEQLVIKMGEPRVAVIWAKLMYNGDRWIEGEPLIAADERAIDMYDRITGMQLKTKEFADMDDPQTIVRRAIQTGREFNDKESIILQDLNAAVSYAKHIIGPWPELEEKLKSEPELQDKYRQEVLHGFY
jgi:hypothetical protein